MTWQQIGLSVFVVTAVGTLAVLAFDLYLYLTNQTMITDYCRDNPGWAWLILSLLEFGVIGLAVHFMSIVDL